MSKWTRRVGRAARLAGDERRQGLAQQLHPAFEVAAGGHVHCHAVDPRREDPLIDRGDLVGCPSDDRRPTSRQLRDERNGRVEVVLGLLDSSAYWAAIRRVLRSPAPPIISGILPTGAGELIAS